MQLLFYILLFIHFLFSTLTYYITDTLLEHTTACEEQKKEEKKKTIFS